MKEQQINIIILAAGKGTRMRGELPKVLHTLCGKLLLQYVLETALAVSPNPPIVVVGYKAEEVMQQFESWDVRWVIQNPQLGTGDAVLKAKDSLTSSTALILYGDVPLISPNTLQRLIEKKNRKNCIGVVLTATLADPTGYGRIIRDENGRLKAIVEEIETDTETSEIKEINTGIGIFDREPLLAALDEVRPDNKKGEYYLTDAMRIMAACSGRLLRLEIDQPREAMGVNTDSELAQTAAVIKEIS